MACLDLVSITAAVPAEGVCQAQRFALRIGDMQAVECVMDDRHLQLRRLRLLDELALTLICDAVDVRL
jgi:hypothetical protein